MDTNLNPFLKPCQLCEFRALSLKDLLKHIRLVHAHRPGFRITCRMSGCQRSFTTFRVFRNHVYDYHNEQQAIILEKEEVEAGNDFAHEEIGEPGTSFSSTSTHEDLSVCRKKAAAMWLLKVQEKFLLPQSTMEMILKDVTDLIQDLLSDLEDDVNAA